MVRPELADVSDDDLAERSRSGDREAFAGLYERHFTGLYDFAARIVRDRDAAADVVQTTFTKAWTGLEGAGAVRNVKAWLYTIARNAAIDELRHRGREIVPQADDETPDVFAGVAAGPGSDPVAVAQDREVAELVWTSAAALGPQEYSLLDLHVRRDLGPDQLAEALGLSKGAVYTRLSRLRDSVEETVTSTLLLRRGRRECPELDRLLTKMGATELTRAVHAAIRSHRRDCDVCEESRRRFVSPMAILAGLAPVPAAAGLSDAIWERVSSSFDAPADGARPVSRHRVGRVFRRGRVLAAVVAAAVAASTAGVLALGSGPSPIRDPADVRSTTHEIDVPSPDRVVAMAWSRVEDAAAYSVRWSDRPADLPDAVGDLPGTATSATSDELEEGSWYFHLRTQGDDGEWTGTVHVGPFVVAPEEPAPDGPEPVLTIEDVVVQEPRSGMATATVRLTLPAPAADAVEVAYATADGTAEVGLDYREAAGTASIAPGETATVIEVRILSDDIDERDETVVVELSDPANAALADRRGIVTIVTRAVPPGVSVSGTSVLEGDAPGASEAVFEVVLSASAESRVAVRWETRDGTAIAGTDFVAASGTAEFPAGETIARIRVSVIGDTLEEPDETFTVRLGDPTGGARVAEGAAAGTIHDDDEPAEAGVPQISIGDGSVAEGDAGTTSAAFDVRLSEPSEEQVSVRYTIAGDTAAVGSDLGAASGTLRFAPGVTTGRVVATVLGDTTDEPDERFVVNLSAPQRAGLRDGRGVGTIRDDDGTPRASIGDAAVDEGGSATLTVRLSNASSRRVTVRFATAPGTASAGQDFEPTSGTASFTPGETTATIAVPTVADAVDEPDETVFVELSSPSGASVGDGRAVVTIRDDDQVPSVSIGDAAVSEGTGGTTSVTLAVTLSNPSASAIRVDFATVPGTASAGPDYTSASGTLSFPAGATTASVSVGVVGDTVIEPTETFSVVLSNASNASIGDGRGTVTIRDDDGSTPRVLGQSPSTRESSSRLSRLWPGRKTSIEGSAAAIPRASGS